MYANYPYRLSCDIIRLFTHTHICCILICRCMQNTTTQWRRGTQVLEKYTSHFNWRVARERELETEQNCNILTPTLMAISVVSFSFSRAAQPEARRPTLLDAGFHYRIFLQLFDLQTNWLPVSPSYIIVQTPTQYLWNGTFVRHQTEITVTQFTGHSLPVHQSMTVPWNFTLSHIVSQARLRDFFP